MLEATHQRIGSSDATSMTSYVTQQTFHGCRIETKLEVIKFIQCVISECGISLLSSENNFRNSKISNTK
jgi:hypothetical protein